MRASRPLIILTGICGLVASFAGGYLVGYTQKPYNVIVEKLPVSMPVKRAQDSVSQDGKIISLDQLMSVYKNNPNRFRAHTEKSKFHVEGQIESVGEVSGLEDISGFYVPLKSSTDDVERALSAMNGRERFSKSVTLYVKGLTKLQIAELNPGQVIKVDCPKVRVVMDGFVFDDCSYPKDSSL